MIIPKGTVVTIDGKVYRTLEAQVAWNKEELESLDIDTLEELPEQFAELQENVSALGDSVADVVEDVGDLESDMSDAQSDISGLKDRMDSAETNIGLNAGEITQLQFDMGQAQGDITALGNSKLDKPTNTGEVGDVIVKTAGGTEYQSVAPFNPNATYPNVTAGKAISAKSLENVSEDSGATQTEPLFFQATATANGTSETPTAPVFKLKSVRGNTIVYNQLVDGVTSTYPTISGHVYWFKHDPLVSLVTSTGTDINVPTPQDDLLVDLTRWFNGSIPQAILDDPTVFPVNYYDDDLTYSAGELKNCSCTELKTVGFNQFDPSTSSDWVSLYPSSGTVSTNPSCKSALFRCLPNTRYYICKTRGRRLNVASFPDIPVDGEAYDLSQDVYVDGRAIGYTTGANDKYLLVWFYNANIDTESTAQQVADTLCVNLAWDNERNGEYAPYVSHTYPLVWSGKSAGSAYDERLPDGTETTRIGSVDLGSIDYGYTAPSASYPHGFFYATITGRKAGQENIICSKYAFNPYAFANNKSVLGNAEGNTVYFVDDTYTSAADFKTAMNGHILYFELATSITSEGTPYTSEIEGDDYGTMEFDSVVPVGNEFFYPADYSLLIDDLGNYTSYDVTALAKKSDLIPAPVGDGTYTLKAVVSGGTVTYTWEAES